MATDRRTREDPANQRELERLENEVQQAAKANAQAKAQRNAAKQALDQARGQFPILDVQVDVTPQPSGKGRAAVGTGGPGSGVDPAAPLAPPAGRAGLSAAPGGLGAPRAPPPATSSSDPLQHAPTPAVDSLGQPRGLSGPIPGVPPVRVKTRGPQTVLSQPNGRPSEPVMYFPDGGRVLDPSEQAAEVRATSALAQRGVLTKDLRDVNRAFEVTPDGTVTLVITDRGYMAHAADTGSYVHDWLEKMAKDPSKLGLWWGDAPVESLASIPDESVRLGLIPDAPVQAIIQMESFGKLKFNRTAGLLKTGEGRKGINIDLVRNDPVLGPALKRLEDVVRQHSAPPGVATATAAGATQPGASAVKALKADPDWHLLAQVKAVQPTREGGRTVIQVHRTVVGSDVGSYAIKLGKGDAPDNWKRVGSEYAAAVQEGLLGTIPIREITSRGQWTIRVVARDRGGNQREARGTLNVQ